MLYVDIKNIFPTVRCEILFKILREQGTPENVVRTLINIYKDTKHYGLKEAHKTPSENWIRQWLELVKEHQNITFYKVNPNGGDGSDPISTIPDEWANEKNIKYIDYTTLDNMLKR